MKNNITFQFTNLDKTQQNVKSTNNIVFNNSRDTTDDVNASGLQFFIILKEGCAINDKNIIICNGNINLSTLFEMLLIKNMCKIDNEMNYHENTENIDEKLNVNATEFTDSTYSRDHDFYFDNNESSTETTTDTSLITTMFEMNFTLENHTASDVFINIVPSLKTEFKIDHTAEKRLNRCEESTVSNEIIEDDQDKNEIEKIRAVLKNCSLTDIIKRNLTFNLHKLNEQPSIEHNFSNKFKREIDEIESNKNATENTLTDKEQILNTSITFENGIHYFDVAELFHISDIFHLFDGIAATQIVTENKNIR